MTRFHVVVCGGGIAGVEAVLRLRRLAGGRIDITLVSPRDELVYRPLAVLEPFQTGELRRYPLARITADTDTTWIRDRLTWVDRTDRVVHTGGGQALRYDALLLAVGGRVVPSDDAAFVFSDHTAQEYRAIVERLESGSIGSLLFVVPPGPRWPLPLYELALLTAARARAAGRQPALAVCEPNRLPLAAFGGTAGQMITDLLDRARITLHSNAKAHLAGPRRVLLRPSGGELHPDQVITLPRITGPNVRGIPGNAADRYLRVDANCRVLGTDGRIFAAGDATQLPVKQGGVATQQADTAAAGITHLAGISPAPPPLRPVIHGRLLTGAQPLYLTAHLIAGRGWSAHVQHTAPWPVEDKIVARELSRYLATLDAAGCTRTGSPPLVGTASLEGSSRS